MTSGPSRRLILAAPAILIASRVRGQDAVPGQAAVILDDAAHLSQLRAIAIWSGGQELAARGYGRWTPDRPTNIKSASKSVISALAGIAIARGLFSGADQPVATILRGDLPDDPDPRLARVTIGNLLSMQTGMERKSGANYGQWVNSANWVRSALAAPFVGDPGGPMLYSTASTHLVSAALTRASGRTTLDLARDWLRIPGFQIAGWERDPQGIYLGGNEMAMSTRALMAFGATYASGGMAGGRLIIPEGWIGQSWRRRTQSAFTGAGYGYGWFLARMAGRAVNYGWGYGGQMIYVAPATGSRPPLAIAMTSDSDQPSGATGYRNRLHALAERLVAAL
ncbi:serine hydrolase [Paracoccus sp. DMF-8]|uniref:serine hydrolase domain-containing protein n=1 Tax=Paracoccus sp. DMF-8 TaxID=3019445 RepID=UPI0023E885C0|nr:serine hydrolase [Paracoccus sp. DMF-8]MDF3606180.1 serine hydrolase [Paracoccus sp. DMF-8]